MQPLGFVDDGLENFLHHARIQIAGFRPRLALREHLPAMARIADALAVVLERQRGKRVFLTFDEQPDEITIDGIHRRADVGQVTAGTG